MERGLWLCSKCRRQTSVTAGTIFEKTRKPLRHWFLASWEVTSQKYGANALGMQRVLGLGSYETAWAWLHKLRRAMVRPDRDRLSDDVEVDETYLGGEEAGVHGRETISKAIVAVAVELKEGRIARIRLRHVPDVSSESLVGFVTDVVAPGTLVRTDGWKGYGGLTTKGFSHRVTVLSASPDPAHVLMPSVHRVAALLKRWWLGTHQGAISKEHLVYYLDEFTFRFNRRTSKSRGLLFYRLLEQAVRTEHVETDALFRRTGRGRPRHARTPNGRPTRDRG
jgi:transposase-like protein